MRHSQSHLSSLAALLKNAEARRIGAPSPAVVADDSGMIDINAMQARAREERARTTVATRTPVPMVRALPSVETDPDLVFTAARAERRKKVLLGMILGAVGLVALAVGSSRHKAHAPVVDQTAAAAPAPPPPPPAPAPAPPPVVAAPPPAPAPLPVAAAAAPATDPAAPPAKKSKKHKHAKSKGPKLTKVQSAGVP